MAENCMINGERCFKCCEVITMPNRIDDLRKTKKEHPTIELFRITSRVIKVSKRRAKKINRMLTDMVGSRGFYYRCKKFTGSGCGDYENRPYMCSGYPFYGGIERGEPIYNDDCTYFVEVK